MSVRGVYQMTKLIVKYSPFCSNSEGTREFVARFLPQFIELNPQLIVTQHVSDWEGDPALRGFYRDGTIRTVNTRKQRMESVMHELIVLRGSITGFISEYRLHRHQTKRPSVQGFWSQDVVDALKVHDVTQRVGPDEDYAKPYNPDKRLADVREVHVRANYPPSAKIEDPVEDDIYYMADIQKYVTTRPIPDQYLSTHGEVGPDGVPVKYGHVPDRRVFQTRPDILK